MGVGGGGSAAWAQARREWAARTTGLPVAVQNLGVPSVRVDGAGNAYALAAVAQASDPTKRDYLVVKVGPTGALLWTARYNGPGDGDETPVALAVSPQGGVVVTGTSERGGTGEDAAATDIATVKFNGATGAREWVSRYTSPVTGASSYVFSLIIDAQGGVFIGGVTIVETIR